MQAGRFHVGFDPGIDLRHGDGAVGAEHPLVACNRWREDCRETRLRAAALRAEAQRLEAGAGLGGVFGLILRAGHVGAPSRAVAAAVQQHRNIVSGGGDRDVAGAHAGGTERNHAGVEGFAGFVDRPASPALVDRVGRPYGGKARVLGIAIAVEPRQDRVALLDRIRVALGQFLAVERNGGLGLDGLRCAKHRRDERSLRWPGRGDDHRRQAALGHLGNTLGPVVCGDADQLLLGGFARKRHQERRKARLARVAVNAERDEAQTGPRRACVFIPVIGGGAVVPGADVGPCGRDPHREYAETCPRGLHETSPRQPGWLTCHQVPHGSPRAQVLPTIEEPAEVRHPKDVRLGRTRAALRCPPAHRDAT